MLSLIYAVAFDRVIGFKSGLPWQGLIPEDLKRFRAITMGHPVIMGRVTFESLPRPLDGRTNIVVTRNREWSAEGCVVAHSLAEAIAQARAIDDEEVFVIGGSALFEEARPLADRIYSTFIMARFEGDAFFPEIPLEEIFNHGRMWSISQRVIHKGDDQNLKHTFTVKDRIRDE